MVCVCVESVLTFIYLLFLHLKIFQVFGGIEENEGTEVTRKTFMVCVPDRTEDTLLRILKEWVLPGTTIISDGWKAYCNIKAHGYQHEVVNHSVEFVNEDGAHTNKVEGDYLFFFNLNL